MMTRLLTPLFAALLVLCLAQTAAYAKTLPDYQDTMINDWDDILDAGQEAEMRAKIKALRDETGIELVVVTLASRAPYGWDQLEPFATALFNKWGVGDIVRDDGIMVLLLREDREMRIEVGSGYSAAYNRVAQSLVETDFLPHFREGSYSKGLMAGTDAVISEIARPMASGQEAPKLSKEARLGLTLNYIFGAIAAIGTFLVFFGRRLFTRFRRCPSCGRRALHYTRKTTIPASLKIPGMGERRVKCARCDYYKATKFTIASTGSSHSSGGSSGGSFGGGSSSGGGASGRW
ncbi:MAG: hypothetical protein ACJA06_002283 [Halocynthiibacter sp.]|jgi:uncharacterized protein